MVSGSELRVRHRMRRQEIPTEADGPDGDLRLWQSLLFWVLAQRSSAVPLPPGQNVVEEVRG